MIPQHGVFRHEFKPAREYIFYLKLTFTQM